MNVTLDTGSTTPAMNTEARPRTMVLVLDTSYCDRIKIVNPGNPDLIVVDLDACDNDDHDSSPLPVLTNSELILLDAQDRIDYLRILKDQEEADLDEDEDEICDICGYRH